MVKTLSGTPPDPNDLEGWRQAIADSRLKSFRLESIAAAFQDLGCADMSVHNTLTRHLSDALTRMLRKRVDFHHPNDGKDIILDVHGKIFEALVLPASADGKALRTNFGSRVEFRLKTAIAKSMRGQVSPLAPHLRPRNAHDGGESYQRLSEAADKASEEIQAAEARELAALPEEAERGGIEVHRQLHNPSLMDDVREIEESVSSERILSTIPDYLKRLAFRLYMDDVPFKSKRGESIAKACGVSERTARTWIAEIQRELQQNEEAKALLALKVGAKS